MSNIPKIISILEKSEGRTMLGAMEKDSHRSFSYETPFKILISTILSARTKDKTTTPISNRLFSKYKTPQDFLKISTRKIEKEIYSIGFYKVKARRIKQACKVLVEKFNGKVPEKMEELLQIPGVGRKTAGCVLVYAFKKPAIPVDIHVHRISNRIGIVKTKNPKETELELMRIVPKNKWIDVNEVLVNHGQTICSPITPKCSNCSIAKLCNRNGVMKSR